MDVMTIPMRRDPPSSEVYWECRSDLSWRFGTETCGRFADLFEERLRALRAQDENVSIASSYLTVSFTMSGLLSITAPKHIAIRVQYIDDTELFYDNGYLGGIFTLPQPNATPDF